MRGSIAAVTSRNSVRLSGMSSASRRSTDRSAQRCARAAGPAPGDVGGAGHLTWSATRAVSSLTFGLSMLTKDSKWFHSMTRAAMQAMITTATA
ncbi:MAG: hypothetical protein DLM58_07985, partial [Pseudonocardiales bacterium]